MLITIRATADIALVRENSIIMTMGGKKSGVTRTSNNGRIKKNKTKHTDDDAIDKRTAGEKCTLHRINCIKEITCTKMAKGLCHYRTVYNIMRLCNVKRNKNNNLILFYR